MEGSLSLALPGWRVGGGSGLRWRLGLCGGTRMGGAGLEELGLETIGESLWVSFCWVTGWHMHV